MGKKKKQILKIEKEKRTKIEAWQKHRSEAKERRFYSIQRIDLLIITISSATIYIVLQVLQFLLKPENCGFAQTTTLLKLSACLSVLAIIVNFLSQITGYQANKNEELYAKNIITHIEDDITDDSNIEHYKTSSDCYSKYTNWANKLSFFLMVAGILVLMFYFLVTF